MNKFISFLLRLFYGTPSGRGDIKRILESSRANKVAYVTETDLSKEENLTYVSVQFRIGKDSGGGGLFVSKGSGLGIRLEWLGENELLVQYPRSAVVTHMEGIIWFLGDFVKVKYEEI